MTVVKNGVTKRPYYRRRYSYYRNPRWYYRRDTLTGGTNDVNPQYFRGHIHLSAADTITEQSYQLPVTRIPTASRVTIIEVLRVFIEFPNFNPDAVNQQEQQFSLLTSPWGIDSNPTISSNFLVTKFERSQVNATVVNNTQCNDLTDGAGHGVLVASDKIIAHASSTNDTPNVDTFHFCIEYRFKNIGIREYAGIVQSQQ